ncbi:MAG: type I-E CRISPR-associated endoribonuclease Cas2e [Anaerococcus prevotii]|uniref:type I-E CRISPR-associated endoribonuclease Cas2e n=1 Tax=Anaerococcus prevotii TaxID=33034 RepID=UPI0028FFAF49|nr:type I-E CRISPR-associated endoribonuclease Cas2e [Anaerococcus prevotii]MDU2558520.1 type I-E CRISPR-associated endoribonuclease Cas2e [Anaerococcus prevotii]MDU2584101.1 type I-E CRISPR-associated endoribonuclease Cas2e [Anaerococcus prevotii]
MPFTIITLSKVKSSLRGDLTKWMQEIDTGVYVGNFNSKVRENLWQRIINNIGDGSATMSYSYRNEIGYDFKTYNTDRKVIYSDSIPLILRENKKAESVISKNGFSKQAKIRKAQKYKEKKYIVIDIETSGLDYKNHKIIEVAAVLTNTRGKIIDTYQSLIKQNIKLPKEISDLTGIMTEDIANAKEEKDVLEEFIKFIGNYDVVGYNVNFDINFINYYLNKNALKSIENKVYDLKDYVKREKLFMKNYRLQTALKEYAIEKTVKHRALEDAYVTTELSMKVNEFLKKIK